MQKQWNIDDFTIIIGQPSVGQTEGANRSRIVIAPYAIQNNSNEIKKFSNERYDYIIKGDVIKKAAKEDSNFQDSLVNQDIMPHSVSRGYIRIPFKGNGMYGIVLKTINRYINTKQVVWQIGPPPIPPAPSIFLKAISGKTQKEQQVNCISSLMRYKKYRPANSLHSKKLDEQDEYILRETTRSEVFGGGRKKSLEWNNRTALKRYSRRKTKKKAKKHTQNT